MSRGLGRIEQAILAIFEGEDGYVDDCMGAIDLARHIYPGDERRTRSQLVAVLRAMHSLVRKYPDCYALAGGKGRAELCIGTPKAIAKWQEDSAS
jgi:hypothetical protein